ncbi:MAG TPA: hypothetical protein VN281_06140 [Verrucomicrobiae bacterium]|nr:hypothetical protein [Verrucomicrobiae bacterium]
MIDDETLAQMNGKYVMPPDAGPAWRAAYEYGIDMAMIADALQMTPESRLEAHQRALNLILGLTQDSTSNATG